MERPYVSNIEDFITEFIKSVGGKTVTDFIGKVPTFDNADYYFDKENVLIELKCFEKDSFSKEDEDRKVQLMVKWLEQGKFTVSDMFPEPPEKFMLPEECIQEMILSCRKTFETAIRKGNRQLRETKKHIGSDKTLRVLLLCNDGNYFLTESATFDVINDIFARRTGMEVDCFVFFTINQVSRSHGDETDWMLWYPSYHIKAPDELCSFINWLGKEHNAFYNAKFGLSNVGEKDHKNKDEADAFLKSQFYVPKNIIYKNRK